MTFVEQNLLSVLIWLPIIGGLLVLATGNDRNPAMTFKLGIGFALATFGLSIPLYTGFDTATAAMQFVEQSMWVERYSIEYYLGVDGISMPLVLLSTFLTVIVMIAAISSVKKRISQYIAAFLIMEGYIHRTPRGREATPKAYKHLDTPLPGREGQLFE